MKWFEHATDARNDVKIKLLKAKFGAEGYGVYFQLLEVIAENIKNNNFNEWGLVDELHSIDTLAIESGVSPDKLRAILNYCNEIKLLLRIDGRLACPQLLDRVDEYAKRYVKSADITKRKDYLQSQLEGVGIVSGQNRDNVALHNNTTQYKTKQNKHNSDKQKLAPKGAVKDKSLNGYEKAKQMAAGLKGGLA